MNWKIYQNNTKGLPPHPLLIKAVTYALKGKVLDFGAGALRDSHYLIKEGFQVTGLDAHSVDTIADPNFSHALCTFENFAYPVNEYSMISAQFAFPFIAKVNFNNIWDSLYASLRSGGIITGNFFGTQDDWKNDNGILTHSSEEVKGLLQQYTTIYFDEKEYDKPSADGKPKHWHVISFIAKKH